MQRIDRKQVEMPGSKLVFLIIEEKEGNCKAIAVEKSLFSFINNYYATSRGLYSKTVERIQSSGEG